MIAQTLLAQRRGEHNIERRKLAKRRRTNWKSNFNRVKQAISREAKDMMKRRAQADVKTGKSAPGFLTAMRSLFMPRTMRGV